MKTAEKKIEGFPTHMSESIVRLIPASQLSLSDEFLKYIPQTEREQFFKEQIMKVISEGVCDFYFPIKNPCFKIAFCAVLIKELVASGKSVEWAWNVVCNDSKELRDYWNSANSKPIFEDSSRRENCVFHDSSNTAKFLGEDRTDYGCGWIVLTEDSADN